MGNTSWRAGARLQRARRKLTAAVTAGVGLALVVPMLAATPAQAGLLDGVPIVGDVLDPVVDPITGDLVEPVVDTVTGVVTNPDTGAVLGVLDPITGALLVAPTPVIAPGGGGEIEFLGEVVCASDGTAQKTCDALPLGELGDLTSLLAVVLTAVPADDSYIPQWTGDCAAPLGQVTCQIPLEDLAGDTPLAPVLTFLPGGDGGAAPDIRIVTADPASDAKTPKRTAAFTFEADPVTETVRYECQLTVTRKGASPDASGWDPCGVERAGGQSYTDLTAGTYTFEVRAVEGEGESALTDPSPASTSWTVYVVPESPETSIVSGPRSNSWILTNKVAYSFKSTVAGSQFDCRYDNALQDTLCDDGNWSIRGLTVGSHLFTVEAIANNTRDFSPARRSFHVPWDDRAMVGKSWTRAKAKKHFKNTVTTTTAKGAALTTRQKLKFRRVVLVADKGPGFGTVKVFWGKKMLKEVDLRAKRLKNRRVIPIKRFSGPLRSGKLRVVVVSSGKTVRIDGIGAAKR